jgi:hypothetical protein
MTNLTLTGQRIHRFQQIYSINFGVQCHKGKRIGDGGEELLRNIFKAFGLKTFKTHSLCAWFFLFLKLNFNLLTVSGGRIFPKICPKALRIEILLHYFQNVFLVLPQKMTFKVNQL